MKCHIHREKWQKKQESFQKETYKLRFGWTKALKEENYPSPILNYNTFFVLIW